MNKQKKVSLFWEIVISVPRAGLYILPFSTMYLKGNIWDQVQPLIEKDVFYTQLYLINSFPAKFTEVLQCHTVKHSLSS